MIQYPSTIILNTDKILTDQPSGLVRTNRRKGTRFDKLVQDLKDALGPSSGLTSDDVDVEHLTHLMEQYDPTDKGWRSYFFGDTRRDYTRNLVDEGNGKSNLVGRVDTEMEFPPVCIKHPSTNQGHGYPAGARMVPRQIKPDPRPRQRPLPDENSQRRLDGNSI